MAHDVPLGCAPDEYDDPYQELVRTFPNSCVVTPTGTLNSGIVQLITVTTAEANAESAGTLFKTQDFGFDVKDCAQGYTGYWRNCKRFRYYFQRQYHPGQHCF
ncbi:hypothetical protein BANRA_05269 [Klebsiella pneumoniae]|nr:hypothetical protein BANRA_05269 [Klebsiella pneumoniae]